MKYTNLEELEKKKYTLDYFIDSGFLSPVIKKTSDFQNITAQSDLKIKNYVRNIVNNNRDLEEIRVFVANIHTIKGMEFDNVVLDLKINRDKAYELGVSADSITKTMDGLLNRKDSYHYENIR